MYCGCFSIWCFNASRMHCCFDWYFFKWGNVEITGLIVSRIILLITVQILHTNTFIQKEILIPKIQWISIIVFPCGTVLLFTLR